MGDFIIFGIVIVLMVLAGVNYFKKLKNGGCGSGCSGCAMNGKCHNNDEKVD